MRTTLLLLPVLCATFATGDARAQQVNRCTDAQGRTVYGDKPCETMGARARLQSGAPRATGSHGLYRDSCARRLSEVVAQIQSAVESRDANRLSGIYLWSGLSNAAATRAMDRLDDIVQRPLVDIAPVFAEVPDTADTPPAEPAPLLAATTADAAPAEIPFAEAPRYQRPRPVALRLEQTVSRNSATPSRTVLRLRRQYNCFWISL